MSAVDAFDVPPGYLNTASVGLPPRTAVDDVADVLARWRRGAVEPAEFDAPVVRSRAAWARLAGVPPEWVAIGSTVSGLVGLVAASLPDGASVLVAEGEFSSVVFPFLAQHRRGVLVRETPLERLVEAVDERVDLVAVSAVQSADGRIADVEALTARAADAGARVLLDTTQSCGWLPVDCSRVDYTVCAAYKWLLCPRGVAFLAVRPERLDEITPSAAGWYAGGDVWSSIYGTPLRLSNDARRLDTSPAWFSWVGAVPALELLASLDLGAVRAHDVGLADAFLARLGLPPQQSAIVSLHAPGAADELAARGIRAAMRGGRVRLSFHLYNTLDDVAAAAAAVAG